MKSFVITLFLLLYSFFLQAQPLRVFLGGNGRLGYKDGSGKIIVPAKYSSAGEKFKYGLERVGIKVNQSYKWGFIDKDGNEVIPLIYDEAEEMDISMDEKENIVIAAKVTLKGETFKIRENGKKIEFPPPVKEYYFEGTSKLMAKGKEVNGQKVGEWFFFFENGQLMSKYAYNEQGKLDGAAILFHPNGKLHGKEIHKNGVFIKPGDYFDNAAKPVLVNGTGYLLGYHTNGAVSFKSNYKNFSRDGLTTWYYNNGQVSGEATYKYSPTDPLGLRWEVISSFDKYGSAREKGTLKNGNGTWVSYDDNGKSSVNYYLDGEMTNAADYKANTQTNTGSTDFQKGVDLFLGKEYKQAHDLFLKLALVEQNADAITFLGDIYGGGLGVPVNYTEALEWYKKGAYLGQPFSMSGLGQIYYKGLGVAADYKKALEWFKKAAEKGDDLAMTYIGDIYYFGYGVTKSFSTAMDWYKKAADKGEAAAMGMMGEMYYRGEGVADNFSTAMYWYKKSADKGNNVAMERIGEMYYRGEGVKQNFATALDWYNKAIEAGNAEAMRYAGYMYAKGEGITKDLQKALNLFQKSVENDKDNPAAYNDFAYGYFYVKNYDKAIEVLNKAIKIDPNYANGYDSIGEMYEAKGDRSKAIEYYKKAASMGHENAINWLKKKGIEVP